MQPLKLHLLEGTKDASSGPWIDAIRTHRPSGTATDKAMLQRCRFCTHFTGRIPGPQDVAAAHQSAGIVTRRVGCIGKMGFLLKSSAGLGP